MNGEELGEGTRCQVRRRVGRVGPGRPQGASVGARTMCGPHLDHHSVMAQKVQLWDLAGLFSSSFCPQVTLSVMVTTEGLSTLCYGKINKVPHFLSQGLLRKTCIIVPVLPTPRCYCGDQAHKALGSPGLHPVFRLQGTLGPQGAFRTWSLVVWLLLLAELEFVAGVGICRTVTVAAAALLFPHPPFVFSNSHLPISIFSFSLIVGE